MAVPYRQIRAQYDAETITVYQAYNTTIADAAVENQKLNASPSFKPGRMTWIKPSWSWMLYRAGYSYKDAGQARILALKMKHEHFIALLEKGVLSSHVSAQHHRAEGGKKEKSSDVRIQWDPERTPKLEALPYRSIQIGIPGALSDTWANEWIVEIVDVTATARELKKILDENPRITTEELVRLGLVPDEQVFTVPDSVQLRLGMVAEANTTAS